MNQSFLDKYCAAPSQQVMQKVMHQITKESVIENFTNFIDNSCKSASPNSSRVITYKFPEEFHGQIIPSVFWQYIINFLNFTMKFNKIYVNRYTGLNILCNCDYDNMPCNSYYPITEKNSSHHGEYFKQDYYCHDDIYITSVVIRIFKSQ